MAHRSEQGNILGFVLVGVLFVGLVAGGVWVVRSQLAKTGGEETATESTSSDKTTEQLSEAGSSDVAKDPATDLKDALAAQQKEQEKKAEEQRAAQDAESNAKQSSATTSTTSPHSVVALPETGPGETLLSVAGATSLAGLGAAYVRSRRLL